MVQLGENVPVGVGVVGVGRMGAFHVERLGLRDDFRLLRVYDANPAACRRLSRHPAEICTELSGVLGDPRIEVVLLATPPATLPLLAIAALEAGKHIVVESPLALGLREADAIIETAIRQQRVACVVQFGRWDGDFRTAHTALRSGALGRPLAIRRIAARLSAPAAPVRQMAGDWRGSTVSGGGCLWECGAPCFDQLLQLVPQLPESVYAQIAVSQCPAAVDQAFVAQVRFPGGTFAHIEVDRTALAPLETGWMIQGETGAYAQFTEFMATSEGEIVDVPLDRLPTASDDFYAAVFRCLRVQGPNPGPPADARRVLRLIAAARHSAQTGEIVRLDLETQADPG